MVLGMRRMLTTTVAALLITASPAFASGKGGGGGTPVPPPAPVTDPCAPYLDMPAYPDGSSPLVNRTNGGCVIVRAWPNGALTLDSVALLPGWTYTVQNGGGTNGRVQLSFENPTTGQTASIRV
jgi:hypothetical protein